MPDLMELKENGVRESRTLDYKSELPLDGREARKEFLADVTAFANTAGGDLVVGVTEKQGEPEAFPGIEIADWDEFQLRLTNLIRDGTEPRLQGLSFHRVSTTSGRYVLILRVPRSYRRPHRVVLGGHGHFYGRDSAQKYQLDVEDLRRTFTQAAGISEVLQQFRAERADLVRRDQAFSSVPHSPKAVLHLIPEDSLAGDRELDLSNIGLGEARPLPRAALGYSHGVALEGIYWYNEWAYTALFRNGIIEAVEALIVHKGMLSPNPLQQEVVDGVTSYLPLLRRLGVDPPFRIVLTLIGVKGCAFPVWSVDTLVRPRRQLVDDTLELNGPILDTFEVEPALALRPLFDRLWNAFGYARCGDYDETGAWRPRQRSVIA